MMNSIALDHLKESPVIHWAERFCLRVKEVLRRAKEKIIELWMKRREFGKRIMALFGGSALSKKGIQTPPPAPKQVEVDEYAWIDDWQDEFRPVYDKFQYYRRRLNMRQRVDPDEFEVVLFQLKDLYQKYIDISGTDTVFAERIWDLEYYHIEIKYERRRRQREQEEREKESKNEVKVVKCSFVDNPRNKNWRVVGSNGQLFGDMYVPRPNEW